MSQARRNSFQNLTEAERSKVSRKGKRASPWSKGPIVRSAQNQQRHDRMHGDGLGGAA